MSDKQPLKIGSAARERRKALGLTIEELARLAGTGPVFVIQFEQGKRTVRLDKVEAVLNVLGLGLVVQNVGANQNRETQNGEL